MHNMFYDNKGMDSMGNKKDDGSKKAIVAERFELKPRFCETLRARKPQFGFGGFGEATYYRTYSRNKEDGTQEHWADTVIRVTNGVLSVRKHHYVNSGLLWDEGYWQRYAAEIAEAMFGMKWLPPGRGLWAMGTEYVYTRGGAALNNCGAVDTAVSASVSTLPGTARVRRCRTSRARCRSSFPTAARGGSHRYGC